MNRSFLLSIFLLPFFLILSCSDDGSPLSPPPPQNSTGIYILNEGNFNRDNSTLSVYLPDSNGVYENAYESVNGRKLGDTGNSIIVRDDRAYIVLTGSGRVEILDTKTHKSIGYVSCPAGAGPRHLAWYGDTKAYLSNLYDNSVSIVDIQGRKISGRISVGANPEELLVEGNFLYVANSGLGKGRSVSVIDCRTDNPVKTLIVGDNPMHIARWNSSTAVVLCGGDFGIYSDPNDDTPGKIFFINTISQSVIDSMTIGNHPFEIAVDDGDHLYTIAPQGIISVDLRAKTVGTSPLIKGNFYALYFDTRRRRLIAADPKDYVQPGNIGIYDSNGFLLSTFRVGVNPGSFAAY